RVARRRRRGPADHPSPRRAARRTGRSAYRARSHDGPWRGRGSLTRQRVGTMAEVTPNLQGRFLLRKKLGEGGMAEVWHAYDSRLGVWRAVKVLLPTFARRTKLRQRFESEARAMALLEHPNIVRIYDVGSEGEQSWIVMELCEGGTLDSWLKRHGIMPPRLAVEVILQ